MAIHIFTSISAKLSPNSTVHPAFHIWCQCLAAFWHRKSENQWEPLLHFWESLGMKNNKYLKHHGIYWLCSKSRVLRGFKMPNLVSDILFFWVVKTRKSPYLQVTPDFFWLAPEQLCEQKCWQDKSCWISNGSVWKGVCPLRKQSLFYPVG